MILLVLDELARSGNASPLDKSKQKWLVHWHTLEEWGTIIYDWAQNKGLTGSVCTFYELTQGDDTVNEGIEKKFIKNNDKMLEFIIEICFSF